MASTRTRRLEERIKALLAEVLHQLKDPRIGFVTLTDVRTTRDLGKAEVFYTVYPDDEATRAETAAGLESASPVMRHRLGGALKVRHVPALHFIPDPLPAQSRRLDELLHDAGADAGEMAGDAGEDEGDDDR